MTDALQDTPPLVVETAHNAAVQVHFDDQRVFREIVGNEFGEA